MGKEAKKYDSASGYWLELNRGKQRSQMILHIVIGCFLVHLLLFAGMSAYVFQREFMLIRTFWQAKLMVQSDRKVKYGGSSYGASEFIGLARKSYEEAGIKILFIYGTSMFIFVSNGVWLKLWHARRKTDKMLATKHLRGAELKTADEVRALIAQKTPGSLPIGALKIPKRDETTGLAICGAAGAGKTQLIYKLLTVARRLGWKAVVYVYKADDYFARFYDPDQDLIFNPVDRRSKGWNIFNEIKNETDLDAVASSMIPTPEGREVKWPYRDACSVFRAVLLYCCLTGKRSNRALYDVLNLPPTELIACLSQHAETREALSHIGDLKAQSTKDVLSTLRQHTSVFRYMAHDDGDLDLGEWMAEPCGGFLYVINHPSSEDTIRGGLTLFLDMLARKLLAMPDDSKRRVMFVFDEIGTLNPLVSIQRLITLGRSKGSAVIVGTQDIGQVEKLYGREGRQSIMNSLGTKVVMKGGDPDTLSYLSELIGDAEVIEKQIVESAGAGQGGSLTVTEQKIIRRAVLASEVGRLEDNTMIVKFPGDFPWFHTRQVPQNYPTRVDAFDLRAELLLEPNNSEIGGTHDLLALDEDEPLEGLEFSEDADELSTKHAPRF